MYLSLIITVLFFGDFLHWRLKCEELSCLPSWDSTCVVGMTVAVGVGVGTGAGVIIGLMLARGVGLFPGLTGCLLAVATTGVGLMLAVGGSDVLALIEDKFQDTNDDYTHYLFQKQIKSTSSLVNTLLIKMQKEEETFDQLMNGYLQ